MLAGGLSHAGFELVLFLAGIRVGLQKRAVEDFEAVIRVNPVSEVFLDARVGARFERGAGQIGVGGIFLRLAVVVGKVVVLRDVHELVPEHFLLLDVDDVDLRDDTLAADFAFRVIKDHHGAADDAGRVGEALAIFVAGLEKLGGVFGELWTRRVAICTGSARSGRREAIVFSGGFFFLRRPDRVHEGFDLIASKRTAEVAQNPAHMENDGRVFVHVVHEEDACAEPGERLLHEPAVKFATGGVRCAFQAVEHAHLVAFRLQTAEPPRADVRERLVIEISGVLRGQKDAETKSACLFEQDHHRLLRWRHRRGRQIAENLVHVEDGAQ